MTELRGTFDAAKSDWSKLFGEAPKSIDDIDVIGLHDKTINKKREFVAIDRVLEIIDEKHDDFCDGSFRDNSITYAQAWKRSNEAIREAVEGLRGEE